MGNTLVIFGASGDLTRRKLIPALFSLHCKGRLPPETLIVGVSRRDYTNEDWRRMLADSTAEFQGDSFEASKWSSFAALVQYHSGDITNLEDLQSMEQWLAQLEGGPADRTYYVATKPTLYPTAVANLGQSGMADDSHGKRRIVIEKPFGTDLETAHQLNQQIHCVFREEQVFRIDHYLGKETVQNLLVLRFANAVFEPIWNRNYIEHVQITVAESVSVGTRGGYYDSSGVLRDMFQNHLLQLMTIVAMEAPARYTPKLVRDEKVKVLQAVRPMSDADFPTQTVRGQYAGYQDEDGVPDGSQTETFAALKLNIDNWRWQGVPFYLRSGKSMSCRTTQLVVEFRKPPFSLFGDRDDRCIGSNRLLVQVQPAEGISMFLQTKVPDAGMSVRETPLDFRFSQHSSSMPDAYQRLLLDAFLDDPSLFARSDEVELAWQIIDPIVDAWNNGNGPELQSYQTGDWGPATSTQWMRDQGREWFDVCPVL